MKVCENCKMFELNGKENLRVVHFVIGIMMSVAMFLAGSMDLVYGNLNAFWTIMLSLFMVTFLMRIWIFEKRFRQLWKYQFKDGEPNKLHEEGKYTEIDF